MILVGITAGKVALGELVDGVRGLYVHRVAAELCPVKEKSSFRGGFALVGYRCRECGIGVRAAWSDDQVCDFAAE